MRNPHKPWIVERRLNWGTQEKPNYVWSALGVWWFDPYWTPEFPAEGLRIAFFSTREKAREAIKECGAGTGPYQIRQIVLPVL